MMKRGNLWIAVGIFFLALVPRVLFAFAPHPTPFSDMEDYDRAAVNFLIGRGLAMSTEYVAYRPPGYPLFLAGMYTLFGHSLTLVRLIQSLLSSGSCVLLYLLARDLLSSSKLRGVRVWVPLVLGIGLALYETHIFLSSILLTETFYVFLLLLFSYLSCSRFSRSRWAYLIRPMCLGVLALIRPVGAAYLPALMYADFRAAPSRSPSVLLRSFILTIALFLLPIVPWIVRNAVVLNAFVPLSTNAGVNFYIGHHPGYSYWSTGQKEKIRAVTDLNEVEENRLFFRIGLTYIFQHPFQTVIDTGKKFVYLFRPGIPPWPMRDRGYDLVLPYFSFFYFLLIRWNWIFLAVLPIGMVWSWIVLPGSRPLVILALCHIFVTICFFARSRFRVPLEPFFLFWITGVIGHMLSTIFEKVQKQNRVKRNGYNENTETQGA